MFGLFGAKEAGDGVKAALDGAGGFAESVRAALTGDLKSGDKVTLLGKANDLLKLIATGVHETNKVEAKHPSLFVAGWRPFIGWNCGVAFSLYMVIFPLFDWYCRLWGFEIIMPIMHMKELIAIMSGMLGFTVTRTIEKLRGVQGNH